MHFEHGQQIRLHGADKKQQMPLICTVESYDAAKDRLTVITTEGKRLTVELEEGRVWADGATLMTPQEKAMRGIY